MPRIALGTFDPRVVSGWSAVFWYLPENLWVFPLPSGLPKVWGGALSPAPFNQSLISPSSSGSSGSAFEPSHSGLKKKTSVFPVTQFLTVSTLVSF